MKRFGLVLLLILIWSLPANAQQQLERIVSQRFEYGEMIYRQSTGDIFVLYTQSGTWEKYTSAQYGGLPANPINSPSNRISPRNGFGQLWYGFSSVRNRIGWAVLTEIGFETRVMLDAGDAYLWRIDGLIYHLRSDGTWGFADTPPEEPEDVNIHEFTVTPETVNIGDTITIQWQVSGTDYVLIEIYDTGTEQGIEFLEFQNLDGSLQWSIPESVGGDLIVTVHAANFHRSPRIISHFWERVQSSEVVVQIEFNNESAITTHAAYQSFAQGFMIWREDTGDVRVFLDNGTWYFYSESHYGDLPTNDLERISGCARVPINAFAIVWGTIGDYRNQLGCPLADEQGYNLTIVNTGGNFTYTLPDGRQMTVFENSWSF